MKTLRLNKLSLLVTGLLTSSFSYAIDYHWDSFESDNVGQYISSEHGQVSISPNHYKDGQHALLWQFQPSGQLVFNQPIDINYSDDILPQTFLVWMYNEKSLDQPLTFSFYHDGKVYNTFKANMDFTGWRGIAVPYRDMQGEKADKLDKLVITAPDEAGKIYFDQMMFNIPVDNRNPIPDYVVPFVNPSVNTAVNKNWNALLMYDKLFTQHYSHLNFDAKTFQISKDAQSIYERLETHLGITNAKVPTSEDIEKNLAQYETFGITEKDGVIEGKILDFPARQSFMKNKQVFNDAEQKFLLTSISMRDLGKAMLTTAKLLRNPNLPADAHQKLTEKYLLASNYLFDQGFDRGSSMQIVTHMGYQMREILDSWFLTRDLLTEHHLLDKAQGAMMWFSGMGRIFEPEDKIVSANVDILNTQAQWMLKSILLIPDEKQQAEILKQYSTWLSQTITQSQGVAGGFKADGSIFHHSQHYTAYAKDAFIGLSPIVYALSNSPYTLTDSARERLANVLDKMWTYTKNGHIPLVLSGRHPEGGYDISPAPYKWFALAGEIDHPNEINKHFAGIYAALAKLPDFMGVQPAEEPTGAWTMNFASMVIQRRHAENPKTSWLAIARGFSRYLVGNESYEKNNRYGRYLNYGALEIIPSDYEKRSFNLNGWDWNRYPGTTTIHLPYPELKSQLVQLPAAGLEEMLLSTETYSGGTDLNNDSMFAMKLHGHSKYHQESFHAKKSYFLFGNEIVALGSDIKNDDDQHHTETTLFQWSVPNQEVITANDKQINTLGTKEQLNSPVKLIDPAGNAYFLAQNQKVRLSYGTQHSVNDANDKPTEGNFATAIIDHGVAPKESSYEYAILIAPKADEKVHYQKLSQDSKLHAVKDTLTGMEGYAYFEADNKDVGGFVLSANNPLIVMAQAKDKQLDLSIVNPDLALYKGTEADQEKDGKQIEVSVYSREWREAESQPQQSSITVKGKWKLSSDSQCAKVQIKGENTQVDTTTVKALPCKISLTKE